jgi:hypothetical protein
MRFLDGMAGGALGNVGVEAARTATVDLPSALKQLEHHLDDGELQLLREFEEDPLRAQALAGAYGRRAALAQAYTCCVALSAKKPSAYLFAELAISRPPNA